MMIERASMREILSEEYLNSDVYKNLIMKDVENAFFQEENIANWNFRSSKLKSLGAWRWLSTYRHKDIICKFIFSDKKGIDFGGSMGPIWGNTEIIDIEPKYMYRQIKNIEDGEIEYIFTSHTLEHIRDLRYTLKHLYRILADKGTIIVIVPAWNCERWRAGSGNSHKWTFSLEDGNYVNIVKQLDDVNFIIQQSEYTWDNSIFILATKSKY